METTHTEQPDAPVATPMPWSFTCAIWVPTFAVVLWFMLRLFGPRPIVPEDPDAR